MKKKGNTPKPSSKSLFYSFESFCLESSEREFDEALISVGKHPTELLNRANAAIESALAKASNSQTEKINSIKTTQEQKVLHKGLQTLVHLLRRNSGLSEAELAEAARVDVDEIRNIEQNEGFTANPRTVYQLEEYFKLKPRTLVLVSGAVTKHSSDFTNEVLQFAAHSKEIGKLSKEEKKLLNEFVRFLSKELKKLDEK